MVDLPTPWAPAMDITIFSLLPLFRYDFRTNLINSAMILFEMVYFYCPKG